MALVRTPEDQIANVLDIDPKTLRKYFSVELKRGRAKGEVNLRQKAYRIADNGDDRMIRYLLDKIDAKQNRGYHENDSEHPSIGDVRAKLETLLNRRAAAAQFAKLRAEQLSLSPAEAEAASDTDPSIFYRAPKPD
jgi:hypothetical protein